MAPFQGLKMESRTLMSCHFHQSVRYVCRLGREEDVPSHIHERKTRRKEVNSAPVNVIEDEEPTVVCFFQPESYRC
jgi:hypothetical protein